jgi:type I restriction enzyme S subunit
MSVPALRFKNDNGQEFPEWKKKNISDVLKIGSGKDYKKLEFGNIPVYGTGGYMLSVNDYLYDGESVCIGRKGTIDRPVLLSGKFWTVDTLFYTHSFVSSLPKFIYALFQNIDWKNYNEAGGVPSLSKSTIEKIVVFIPSLPEQTKIANFFIAVNERITLLTQKADLLSQYKKGVMQQIFSQELRFKDDDGQEFPEWEEKILEELADVSTGNKDTQNKIDDGLYPFYVRSQTVERINSFAYDGEAILTSGDGVGVGKNFHYINGKFDFHQRVYCIFNFKKQVSGRYIFYCFSEKFYKRVQRLNAKGAVDSVRRSMITEMPISIPSFPEQTKIANFLTALDEKITNNQNQLDAVKQYKQGLLQQMLCNS